MKREIKFRGKRVDTGEWTVGGLIVTHKGFTGITTYTGKFDDGKIRAIIDEVDPATVGQFTGMFDKNKNEIYEFDIVKSSRYNVLAVVCFIKGGFAVCNPNCCDICAKFEGSMESLEEAIVFSDGEIEVIGNLHDNPELLKKE